MSEVAKAVREAVTDTTWQRHRSHTPSDNVTDGDAGLHHHLTAGAPRAPGAAVGVGGDPAPVAGRVLRAGAGQGVGARQTWQEKWVLPSNMFLLTYKAGQEKEGQEPHPQLGWSSALLTALQAALFKAQNCPVCSFLFDELFSDLQLHHYICYIVCTSTMFTFELWFSSFLNLHYALHCTVYYYYDFW